MATATWLLLLRERNSGPEGGGGERAREDERTARNEGDTDRRENTTVKRAGCDTSTMVWPSAAARVETFPRLSSDLTICFSGPNRLVQIDSRDRKPYLDV